MAVVVPGRVTSYLCTGRIDGVGGAPIAVNAAGSAPAAAGAVPALPRSTHSSCASCAASHALPAVFSAAGLVFSASTARPRQTA